MEHGHSLVIPPHFDGNNYAYWKVRMKVFLKSINERVWNSVEYGWEKPTTPVSQWQISQKEAAAFNSKAMNAIFNAVSMEEFKRISNVEVAHTAWNILQNMHEGTKAVKINKLQQLTSKFESIRKSYCKVVIYNYLFCWLLFHDKFDCNYIQSVVPYMYYGISL